MEPEQQLRCHQASGLSSHDHATESGRFTSGRSYSSMNIGGNARVHNGDHYTFNRYVADDGPAAKRQKSEHARLQSETLRKEFLDGVRFPEMFTRQESLRANTSGTYEWVFTGESPSTEGCKHATDEDHELRGRILAWLQSPESFFWVKGKPGSGKSMLMSFLLQDPRTKKELQLWAGDRAVHVLSFFFWKAGSDLQKTIPGLLRSIIWQLVRFKQSAVDILLSSDPSLSSSAWSEARLIPIVEQLLEACQDDRILLLVDGLDECEDDPSDLVELLSRFGTRDHMKACFSSRPDVALTMHFGRLPGISLQDLNLNDILIHAQKAFKPYGKALETLSAKVANRAEGVFLWAVLVCKSLIRGHLDRDDKETLYWRLTTLPRGLEGLFARMFFEIDEVHYQSLKLYLHSVDCIKGGTTIALITATLHRDSISSIKHFVDTCNNEQRRIVTQSRGLIEVKDTAHGMENHETITNWALKAISTGTTSRNALDLSELQLRQAYRKLSWVHRSAYEYIHGASRTSNNFQMDADYEDLRNRSLWKGALWLAQFLPIMGISQARADGLLKKYDYSSVEQALQSIKLRETSQAFGREVDDGLSTIYSAIRSWVHHVQQENSFDGIKVSGFRYWFSQMLLRPSSQPMYWFWDSIFTTYPEYLAKQSDWLTRDPETKAVIPGIIARLLTIWSNTFPEDDVSNIDEQRFVAMQLITKDIDFEACDYHAAKNRLNVQLADSSWGADPKLYTWHSSASIIPDEE